MIDEVPNHYSDISIKTYKRCTDVQMEQSLTKTLKNAQVIKQVPLSFFDQAKISDMTV